MQIQKYIVLLTITIISLGLIATITLAQEPAESTAISLEPNAIDVSTTNANFSPSEVVERRTATSKHYQVSPTMYEARISALPIHYQANDGTWQPINTHPIAKVTGGFEVLASDVKLDFPATFSSQPLLIKTTTQHPTESQKSARQPIPRLNGKPDLMKLGKLGLAPSKSTFETLQHQFGWWPQSLVFVTANNHETVYQTFAEANAANIGKEVVYTAETTHLHFIPTAIGFDYKLRLIEQPTTSTEFEAITLITQLNLPTGARLADNMVYDAQNRQLLALLRPQLVDQVGNAHTVTYNYDGLTVNIALPLDWLNDPTRHYPVSLKASVVSPRALFPDEAMSFEEATYIWQCLADQLVSNDDIIRVGNRSNTDNGCIAGIQRALLKWSTSALPINAVVAFQRGSLGVSSVEGDVEAKVWHLPASGNGITNLEIATHRMLLPWSSQTATWQKRLTNTSWLEPGGSGNDYQLTPEITTSVSLQGVPGYVTMGALHDLATAWQTNQVLAGSTVSNCNSVTDCYGYPNYGLMLKATTETASTDFDRAFARGLSSETAPQLTISYFDNNIAIAPGSQLTVPRAPSPDYYEITLQANRWAAIAIKPTDTTTRPDYDLVLSEQSGANNITQTLQSIIRVSQQRGTGTDFMVLHPDSINRLVYPWAIQYQGAGPYRIFYINESVLLNLNETRNLVINDQTVLNLYEFDLEVDNRYDINVVNSSGNADIMVALFPPRPADVGIAYSLSQAIKVADENSFGQGEQITYQVTEAGRYVMAVVNNGLGSSASSTVRVSLKPFIDTHYLPIIVNIPIPPEPEIPLPLNGNFETTSLDNWISTNHSGTPFVTTVTANPDPNTVGNFDSNCFNGNGVGRLGTPTNALDHLANLPVDKFVGLAQQFTVPDTATKMTFNYQVFSYDILENVSKGRIYDYFVVEINGTEMNPPGKVGDPAPPKPAKKPGEALILWDSGCQTATIDMTSYRGQSINLQLKVYNHIFEDLNTWAYIDNIVVTDE